MRKAPLLTLFSILSFLGFSQSISGTVTDEENNTLPSVNIAILNTSIGVFFIFFSILFRQIYNISKEVYLLMNNTFKFVLLLSALISPYFYYYTKAPQLLIIFGINICFIVLLQYEKLRDKK